VSGQSAPGSLQTCPGSRETSLRPPEVGTRSPLRFRAGPGLGQLVGQWSAIAGQVRRGGAELVGEQLERVGDSGASGRSRVTVMPAGR
jgi:hypothetical protein